MKNFYKILEIKENATSEEIREAFRKLAKKTHPDYYHANKDLYQKFQEINEANKILSDINRRTEYDKERKHVKIKKWTFLLKWGFVGILLVIGGYLLNENFKTPPISLANQIQETTKSNISEDVLQKNKRNVKDTEAVSVNKAYRPVRAKIIKQKIKVVKDNHSQTDSVIKGKSRLIRTRMINLKELSENEIKEISKALNIEKNKRNNLMNCVKIQKTSSSNVLNWEAVSAFLRKTGFIISGRETVNTVVKGVQIENSGQCLTLTIGFFPQ